MAARDSSKLATVAQAISNTRPTTAIKIRNGSQYCFRNSDKPLLAGISSIRRA